MLPLPLLLPALMQGCLVELPGKEAWVCERTRILHGTGRDRSAGYATTVSLWEEQTGANTLRGDFYDEPAAREDGTGLQVSAITVISGVHAGSTMVSIVECVDPVFRYLFTWSGGMYPALPAGTAITVPRGVLISISPVTT